MPAISLIRSYIPPLEVAPALGVAADPLGVVSGGVVVVVSNPASRVPFSASVFFSCRVTASISTPGT